MITITSRPDFNILEAQALDDALAYIKKLNFEAPEIIKLEQDDDMSCQMSISYHFEFNYDDEGTTTASTGYVTYFANGTHIVQVEPNDVDIEHQEGHWFLDYGTDKSALLYTVRMDGYRKGKPQYVNDVTIRVEPSNKSSTDITPVVNTIYAALTSERSGEVS